MAYSLEIDRKRRLLTVTFSGDFDLEALMEYWTAWPSHPDYDRNLQHLIDLRGVSMSRFDNNDLDAIAARTITSPRRIEFGDVRTAALLSPDAGDSDARMWKLYLVHVSKRRPDVEEKLRIFDDEEAAMRWLTGSDD